MNRVEPYLKIIGEKRFPLLTAVFKCLKSFSHRRPPQTTEGISQRLRVLCALCGYSP